MKTLIVLSSISLCILGGKIHAQVGIGTTTPNAATMLHIDAGASQTKGILITGTLNSSSGTIPSLGAGSRLMFCPGKAAFRAGYVNGTQWDESNVGQYSSALGLHTTSSGYASFAMGWNSVASDNASFAAGYNAIASGSYSTALGFSNTASGSVSTVMGANNTASGNYSNVMGINSVASSDYSMAMGYGATANAVRSIALGADISTNGKIGSMILGDGGDGNGAHIFTSETDNQLFARFKGGYKFYTTGWGVVGGVTIVPGGNSWSSFSDERMKENFETLNSEEILKKLSAVNYTSWNYKLQDPRIFRHYGIMAQDFYNAFGKDSFGVIGNDTMVNPIDMMGIAYSAIQALEKRTDRLRIENQQLKNEVSTSKVHLSEIADLKTEVMELKKQHKDLNQSITQLLALVGKQQKQMEMLTMKPTVNK